MPHRPCAAVPGRGRHVDKANPVAVLRLRTGEPGGQNDELGGAVLKPARRHRLRNRAADGGMLGNQRAAILLSFV